MPSLRPIPPGILGFLAFSHGFTWLVWAAGSLAADTVWAWPGIAFLVAGGAGVPSGAIAMSYYLGGRRGLLDLGRRIVDPRPIACRWWAAIFLLPPLVTLAAAALAYAFGEVHHPVDFDAAAARLFDPATLAPFLLFTLIMGPLPEEIGWRGYLLDRFQARHSALAASLFVGLLWWTWHLPLFWLPGFFDAFTRASPSPFDFLAIFPVAIIYTWVYNNTGRSVLAVIVLHLAQNASGEILAFADEARIYQTALTTGLAVLILFVWGPQTLRRDRASP